MTNLNSRIEWTDTTWSPVTGCTKVSPGCDHCYAERLTERFQGKDSFAQVTVHEDRLGDPLRWRKPRRVFVNSMSDLFHPAITDEFIARVFAVMAATPQHTYQVLTKRHGRMRSLLDSGRFRSDAHSRLIDLVQTMTWEPEFVWPLPNVWLGVSAEDQKRAELRVGALRETPATVRFVSAEPLLGPVDLTPHLPGLSWVIVGGESGPGARPMDLELARSLVEQCQAAEVPVFVKQLGSVWAKGRSADRKGGDPDDWPADLRIRQFPAPAAPTAALPEA